MSESEFWALTPYEFDLLLDRNTLQTRWEEALFSILPALYAESHRDTKKRKKPFRMEEFTLSGMAAADRRAKKAREKRNVWNRIDGVMKAFGGK